MVRFYKKHFLQILPYLVFIASLLFQPVFSNFAVNDDWIFVRQIQGFTQGDFTISSLIDPSFILQGVLGYTWGLVFGVSFVSLRFLTLLVFALFLVSIHKILKLYKVSDMAAAVTLLTLIFNPIIYNSALSFMTEIYYLCFFSWGIYFYLRDFKAPGSYKYFLLGTVFSLLAFLIRQYGVLTIGVYLFVLLVTRGPRALIFYKKLLISFVLLIVGGGVYIMWPRYFDVNGTGNIFANLATYQTFLLNIKKLLFTLPYFLYFLLPLFPFITNFKTLSAKSFKGLQVLRYLVFGYLVFYLAQLLFKYDIFPLGSVFYIEGLHIKSDFRHILSISDLLPVKVLLSTILSGYFVYFIFHFITLVKSIPVSKKGIQKNADYIFLTLLFFASALSLVVASDFYDRYLLPSLVPLLVLVILGINKKFSTLKMSTFSILVLIGYCFFGFILNLDYFTSTAISWDIGRSIQDDKNLVTQVCIDDVFGKYNSAIKSGDFTGNVKLNPNANEAICFVQSYTLQNPENLMYKLENFLEKHIENPRVYEARKKQISRVKNNLDKLLYSQEYFSPLYNLVGSKALVGGYCLEKK